MALLQAPSRLQTASLGRWPGGLGHCQGLLAPAASARIRNPRPLLRSVRAAWSSAPEPFAPPLTGFADLDRQLQRQMGDLMTSDFASMERRFQQMDRQMDAALADMDRAQRQVDAELERSLRQLQQQQEPGVSIRRSEQRSPGSYRYYESIQIRSGGSGMATLVPATTVAPPLFSPLLFVALVVAGAYAALTAAFNRNFEMTLFRRDGPARWQLLLLWPFLLPFSRSFRAQFVSALRGEKVRVGRSSTDDDAGESSSSSVGGQ